MRHIQRTNHIESLFTALKVTLSPGEDYLGAMFLVAMDAVLSQYGGTKL